MMYSEKLMDYFKNPKFAREIKNPSAVAEEGNIKCGDIFKIFLKIKNNKIKDISYLTYGCIAAIAASESFCRIVKGKTIEEAKKVSYEDIKNDLGDVPAIKLHCTHMVIKTFKKAIENYENKN